MALRHEGTEMAAVETLNTSSAGFRLCLPAWLRLRRADRPAREPAEDERIRRDFTLEMMHAQPEAFAYEEGLREMMFYISRR